MNFYHYSSVPLIVDRNKTYEKNVTFKPNGLWLSVEDGTDEQYGWKEWCEDNEFRLERLSHRTRVELSSYADVMIITSPTELESFTKRFGTTNHSSNYIDWNAVTQRYGGIVITPYQWSKRLDSFCFWYYTWDCASACIWDLSLLCEQAVECAK